MKKAILAAVLTLAFSATAFASPLPGHIQAGYSDYSLKTEGNILGDMGTFKTKAYELSYGFSDKLAFTGSYADSEKHSFPYLDYNYRYTDLHYTNTELGLAYSLGNNVAVTAGHVNSQYTANERSNATSEIFGGVSVGMAISSNLEGHASYLKSAHVQDAKVGVTYDMGNNTAINVNYRTFEDTNLGMKNNGLGMGISYKF